MKWKSKIIIVKNFLKWPVSRLLLDVGIRTWFLGTIKFDRQINLYYDTQSSRWKDVSIILYSIHMRFNLSFKFRRINNSAIKIEKTA